ncbi:hypothetical protein PSTG_11050 [Puccinia striiformis f. sp. tritici PST-78]|uniref:Septin-type G domain-containing protein n=1 Tax=Puccinia striiformis f. sp. tritici PST-78 TaxID=1165861 RepID=A0A0L0V911_9BASI|nr:hypothetical protein PSTG_11050 [Puccinia striiformis f. sp. tritici PST-78]
MGYVDFADLPNQVRCKSVAKGSDSLVMVVGKGQNTDSKSLPSSIPLFIQPSTLPKNISGLLLNGRGQCPIQSILPDIEEAGVRLRLEGVDTPGYGEFNPILKNIEAGFQGYLEQENQVNRAKIANN